MTELQLNSFTEADLTVEPSLQNDAITIALKGNADLSSRQALNTFLDELHGELMRLKMEKVTLTFHDLEFMNSSCFKSFVTWISRVLKLESAQQYKIHFVQNPKMYWQRRSLHALQSFAKIVVIDNVPEE